MAFYDMVFLMGVRSEQIFNFSTVDFHSSFPMFSFSTLLLPSTDCTHWHSFLGVASSSPEYNLFQEKGPNEGMIWL